MNAINIVLIALLMVLNILIVCLAYLLGKRHAIQYTLRLLAPTPQETPTPQPKQSQEQHKEQSQETPQQQPQETPQQQPQQQPQKQSQPHPKKRDAPMGKPKTANRANKVIRQALKQIDNEIGKH